MKAFKAFGKTTVMTVATGALCVERNHWANDRSRICAKLVHDSRANGVRQQC